MSGGKQLARQEAMLPGLLPNEEAARVVEQFNVMELDGEKVLERLPTDTERQKMFHRAQDISAALLPANETPHGRERAATALAELFMGYPSLRNADAASMVSAYVLHLQHQPLFAIRQTCEDVSRHKVKDLDPDWPPAASRLNDIADRYAGELYAEGIRFERVLAVTKKLPPPISADERERIGAKLKAMSDEMRAGEEAKMAPLNEEHARRKREQDQRAILAHYEYLGMEPRYADEARTILVSPSLVKILGGDARQQEQER